MNVRANTVLKLSSNYKSAFSNLKNGNIVRFKMRFKSKKDRSQALFLPKSSIEMKNGSMTIGKHSISKFWSSERKGDKYAFSKFKLKGKTKKRDINIDSQCTLTYDGLYYHVLIPKKTRPKKVQKRCENTIVALDPGLRKFQTGFSQSEIFTVERTAMLKKYNKRISYLHGKFQRNNTRKILKTYRRSANIVSDIHWKLITYLTDNYEHVLIPKFESQELQKITMSKHSNRLYDTYKHYLFKQRLIEKSKEKINTRVYMVNEAYTSVTCTNCGTINAKTRSEMSTCKTCKLLSDRDIRGSRNIFIKYVQ
ncbi:putative transposase [Heterosigma akashiwo virus 01]|uniref:Putative transposase n=1 Tax=Heterosigma akashiwo virus 01 TaxID=97195 RepID=A0A1C9C5D9_HAV01|nr:putative transposase [Heterosigma akashiwo virus 01]AOM63512.1 putative transposase [Heterosigma akashiwo virus 01]